MVAQKSGSEWKDFSNDQMRRSAYHDWSNKNQHHPDDNLDAPPLKREANEDIFRINMHRSVELKAQTYMLSVK